MFNFIRNRARVLFALTLALTLSPQILYAEKVSEYTIKAAFIYNFARFTEWPEESNILKVCIYGKDPFSSKIDKINGKKANNKTITVIRTQSLDEIKTCHIAFLNITPPERRLFERVLREIKGAHVLTISDADGVVDFGVMIELTVDENDKVRFNMNLGSARDENLKISSKIIDLEKEVSQ